MASRPEPKKKAPKKQNTVKKKKSAAQLLIEQQRQRDVERRKLRDAKKGESTSGGDATDPSQPHSEGIAEPMRASPLVTVGMRFGSFAVEVLTLWIYWTIRPLSIGRKNKLQRPEIQ